VFNKHSMDAKLRGLIQKVKKEHDDDVVDRSVYATTVYILAFFAILIMAKQYVGEPLQCWLPAEYTGAWEKYIENYCFVENTYFVNGTKIPDDRTIRSRDELRYYQWIPYILSLMAVICFAPKMIFKVLYSFSDLRVTDLIQLAYRETKTKFADAQDGLCRNIAIKLVARKNARATIAFNWYLTLIYFSMKLLIIGVLILQLVIINYFVASTDIFWGFTILQQLVNGKDWRHNGFFPRVTFCDITTRDIGQSREHTVQCVLMINMFAEKIFVFLWLWFFTFLVVAVLNLVFWMWRTLVMRSKVYLVMDALRLHNIHPSRSSVENFINSFLKHDGVVVLRLIDSNAGYVHMADILFNLWSNFYNLQTPSPVSSNSGTKVP